MDAINQAVAQVRELFLSMSPAARITSALLLGVIVVSLGYLVQSHGAGADDYLFNGDFLQTAEANRIEAAIAKSGLSGYARVGNRFRVPRGQTAAYLAAVANEGALPTNFDTLLQDTLDSSPLLSDATRKQQWKAARERQLSMIVKMMEGVEDAKVLYDVRAGRGFEKEQITATVSVQPAGNSAFGPHQVNMIRKAVAGAIAGLKPDQVTVLDLSGGSRANGSGASPAANFDDPYYSTRIAYEERLRDGVKDLLADIPGLRVQVNAELDPVLGSESREISAPSDGVPIRQTKRAEEVANNRVEDRGPVGPRANGPGRTGGDEAVAKSENSVKNEHDDVENFVPTTEKLLKEAGLVPKHVRVAIAIPSDYLELVWRERNPDKGPDYRPVNEDLDPIQGKVEDSIKGVVAPLLPKELAKSTFSDVNVHFFQSLTPDAIAPPSAATSALFWAAANMNTLLMAGLALVSLVMLRSMVKSIPPSESVTAYGTPALLAESAASSLGAKGSSTARQDERSELSDRPKLKLKKGPSLKDDLLEIVREDPDAAAAILRGWIGNAS